jgi:hypothetical protein
MGGAMKSELGRKRDFEDETVHEKNKRIKGEQDRRLRKELRRLRLPKQEGDNHG